MQSILKSNIEFVFRLLLLQIHIRCLTASFMAAIQAFKFDLLEATVLPCILHNLFITFRLPSLLAYCYSRQFVWPFGSYLLYACLLQCFHWLCQRDTISERICQASTASGQLIIYATSNCSLQSLQQLSTSISMLAIHCVVCVYLAVYVYVCLAYNCLHYNIDIYIYARILSFPKVLLLLVKANVIIRMYVFSCAYMCMLVFKMQYAYKFNNS